jgi:serine/threonine protein kinase/L-rhamnose mutarotase
MREYAVGDEPVPGYQIIRPLGAGGYGTVWVAKSPGDVEIALKIINLQGQGLKEFRAIGLVKKLRHPNLIPIYAFWLKDEFGNFLDSSAQDSVNLKGKQSELILAMGLGDKSLTDRLEECKKEFAQKHSLPDTEGALIARLQELGGAELAGLPLEELLEYMFASARAIDYLNQPTHTLGTGPPSAINHCDIKPGNLLIVSNDLQVCDYGLARVTGDARKTQAAGTPAYMAPELIAGKPSSGTDQYSLAITYYELRTGKLPFDEAMAFHAHITGQLDFGLVTAVEQEILRKATHTRPEDRYPHTIEMVRALRESMTPTGMRSSFAMPAYASSPTPTPPPSAASIPAYQPTPLSSSPPTTPSSTPSGVYRSGSTAAAAAAAVAATPTICTKPTILDDLIRAGQELVPGYKLDHLLGRGGYGEVWSATMPGKTRCALKIVRNLDATQGKQEFKSLDMIRDIDHDRLIRLQAYWVLAYDGSVIPDEQIGQPGAPKSSGLVVATDLAQQNLLQRWQECFDQGQAGIPKEELVPYVRQSAEAIDHLNFHEPAIVHRDIKPENILLTKNRQVKVSDFGLAKLVEGTSAAINSASVGMTLAYAAPEMFRNIVTRWTDQYSLALTYYRLRTGRLPFEDGLGPIQMMQAHASGTLDFSGVGEIEQSVLKRACVVEPEGRFGSCLEFAAALEAACGIVHSGVTNPSMAQTHPISSTTLGPTTPGPRWPNEAARQAAANPGAATAQYPVRPSDGSNIRETLRFEDVKSPADVPPGWPKGQSQRPGSSSDEFHMPDPRRAASSGLPPGLMETTTAVPSSWDVDTAPDDPQKDRRTTSTVPSEKSGRNKLAWVLSAVAVLALVAGGVFKYMRPAGDGGGNTNPGGGGGVKGDGTVDSGAGKGGKKIVPESVADRQRKATDAVNAKLQTNEFAEAAKLVSATVAKEMEKAEWEKWAVVQNDAIAAAWREFAERLPTPKEKTDELQRLLAIYPNDQVAKKRASVLRFEEENNGIRVQFADVLARLRIGDFEASQARLATISAELDRLSKESPDAGASESIAAVKAQVERVSAALADLSKTAIEPATEAQVGQITKAVLAIKTPGAPEYELAIRDGYRHLLGDKIERLVPTLSASTKWADLLNACRSAGPTAMGPSPAAPLNPWIAPCREECAAELASRGQSVGAAESPSVLSPPDKAPPPLAAYYQYVSAAQQMATKAGAKATGQALADMAPDSASAPTNNLNDFRRSRLLAGLRAAVARLQGSDTLARFAGGGAADAVRWLGAAMRLAEKDSKLSAADRLRLKFDLALAYLAEQPPESDKARPLTDALVPDAALKVWQPNPQETVALWMAVARSREATPAGRLAALRAYTTVLETLRDDLNGVRADYLYAGVIRPLSDDGGKQLLGDKPDPATATAAAKLYYLAARNIRRYADVWADFKDISERERLQLIVRLFERAAELDKKPEYIAWVGIAKSEIPGGDPTVALMAGTGVAMPAVHLLRGIMLIAEADKLKDAGERVARWRKADDQFRAGLTQAGSKPEYRDERVLLYQRAANNCIKLANAVGKPSEMRTFLDAAKDDADKLLALDPGRQEMYDTRGCAIEDMAWLRGDTDRFGPNGKYAKAIQDFTTAIGGFGSRATPWMHRGRVRFKWAEDALKQPGAAGLDDSLLTAAAFDLNHVLELTTDSAEALEANFWLAKLLLVRQNAPAADKADLYRQAAEAFRRAVDVALALHSADWHETALKTWSVAAYDEAYRLAPDKSQAARDALQDAVDRAEAVKEFSPPWTAYTKMRLWTLIQKKLDPNSDRIPDAVEVSKTGLAPDCRDQDRRLEFLIRMMLVGYRTSIITENAKYKSGDKALIDATAAMELAEKFGLPEDDKAQAFGAEGLANYFIFQDRSDDKFFDLAKTQFEEAIRRAPDHPESWKWRAYLGTYKMTRELKQKSRATDATRFADAFRMLRDAETSNPRQTGEELLYARLLPGQRADAEKVGYPIWIEQIDVPTEANNQDRPKWLLCAAEKLALHKEELPKAKQWFAAAVKAISALPADEQEGYRRQRDRVQEMLKDA